MGARISRLRLGLALTIAVALAGCTTTHETSRKVPPSSPAPDPARTCDAGPLLRRVVALLRSTRDHVALEIELRKAGPDAVWALGRLVATDGRASLRGEAARALALLGVHGVLAHEDLRRALRVDEERAVRIAAALALSSSGSAPPSAAPLLREATRDPSPAVRRAATLALAGVEAAAPDLIPQLQDSSAAVREAALQALTTRRLGASVPGLRRLATDPDLGVREAAISALGALEVHRALPDLLRALDDPEARIRQAAAIAVGRLGPAAIQPAIPALRRALGARADFVRVEAAVVLARLGSKAAPAVPELRKALAAPEPYVKVAAARALAAIGPRAAAATGDLRRMLVADQRYGPEDAAAAALGAIGPAAGAAIPTLCKALRSYGGVIAPEDVVASALARTGPRGIRCLLRTLRHEQPTIRRNAALGLAEAGDRGALRGKAATPAIQGLAALLRDPDQDAREAAAAALGRIKGSSAAVVPHLLAALGDKRFPVRQAVVRALGRHGGHPAVIPALRGALADAELMVQDEVAKAFGEVGVRALPTLVSALGELDGRVRVTAAKALGELGPAAAPAIPRLTALVVSGGAVSRYGTCHAAWALGRVGRGALPALLRLLGHRDWRVRHRVEAVLRDEHEGIVAVHRLRALLARQGSPAAESAASVLADLGPQAAAAVPELRRALRDRRQGVRLAAAEALGRIGPVARAAAPVRVRMLKAPAAKERAAAARALGELRAPAAARPLMAALADPSRGARVEAALSLAQLGPRADTAVPALRRALTDGDARVRRAAAIALGQVGPRASSAVRLLARALGDRDAAVRIEAARALGKLGRPAHLAVGQLQRALLQSSSELVTTAAAALGQIRHARSTPGCRVGSSGFGSSGVGSSGVGSSRLLVVQRTTPLHLDRPRGDPIGRAHPGARLEVGTCRDGWCEVRVGDLLRPTRQGLRPLWAWARQAALGSDGVQLVRPALAGCRVRDRLLRLSTRPGAAPFALTQCGSLRVLGTGPQARVAQYRGGVEIQGFAAPDRDRRYELRCSGRVLATERLWNMRNNGYALPLPAGYLAVERERSGARFARLIRDRLPVYWLSTDTASRPTCVRWRFTPDRDDDDDDGDDGDEGKLQHYWTGDGDGGADGPGVTSYGYRYGDNQLTLLGPSSESPNSSMGLTCGESYTVVGVGLDRLLLVRAGGGLSDAVAYPPSSVIRWFLSRRACEHAARICRATTCKPCARVGADELAIFPTRGCPDR